MFSTFALIQRHILHVLQIHESIIQPPAGAAARDVVVYVMGAASDARQRMMEIFGKMATIK